MSSGSKSPQVMLTGNNMNYQWESCRTVSKPKFVDKKNDQFEILHSQLLELVHRFEHRTVYLEMIGSVRVCRILFVNYASSSANPVCKMWIICHLVSGGCPLSD